MEYARKQIIAIGLARGELLATEKCGCVIIQDRTADAYIVYCHKHSATLMLYEALLAVYKDIELQNVDGGSDELNIIVQQALAKAGGE